MVERDIGLAEKVGCRTLWPISQRATDAGRNRKGAGADLARDLSDVEEAADDTSRRRFGMPADDDRTEFVAAETREIARRSDGKRDPFGEDLQQLVADRVTEGVVDRFEMIEVEEEDGDLLAANGLAGGFVQDVVEGAAVGKTGQCVCQSNAACRFSRVGQEGQKQIAAKKQRQHDA